MSRACVVVLAGGAFQCLPHEMSSGWSCVDEPLVLLWCLSCEIYRAAVRWKKVRWIQLTRNSCVQRFCVFVLFVRSPTCGDVGTSRTQFQFSVAQTQHDHDDWSQLSHGRNACEQSHLRTLTERLQFQKHSFASAKMKENATRLHMTDFSVLQSIVYHDTRRKSMWESGYDMNEQQHARNECQILTMCVLLCLNFFDGSSFFRRNVSATIQSKKLRGCWVMSVANGLAKRSLARSQCSTGWSGRKFNACLDFN